MSYVCREIINAIVNPKLSLESVAVEACRMARERNAIVQFRWGGNLLGATPRSTVAGIQENNRLAQAVVEIQNRSKLFGVVVGSFGITCFHAGHDIAAGTALVSDGEECLVAAGEADKGQAPAVAVRDIVAGAEIYLVTDERGRIVQEPPEIDPPVVSRMELDLRRPSTNGDGKAR